MLKNIVKTLNWLSRFIIGTENLGFLSAIKVFIVSRYSNQTRKIIIKKLNRDFFFRGKDDRGVLSHFYQPGYRIIDSPENSVLTIIDAGANIGDEVLRFRYFHPDAKIIAIEPESSNYELLKLNCESDPKVRTIKKGLWSKDCFLKILPGNSYEAFRVTEVAEGNTYDVESISINSLVEQFDLKSIDILKLDIEGSEYFLFSENYQEWIDLVKVFIFEAPDSDYPGSVMQIFRALENRKYNVFLHGENIVAIRADVPWQLASDLSFQR